MASAAAPAASGGAQKRKPKKKNPFDVDYGSEVAGKYKWIQTENEVTVTVFLPEGTKAKDIACVIHSNKVTAGVKGQPPIIDGAISKACAADDSYWQFESGNCEITLVKSEKKVWWDRYEIKTMKQKKKNSTLVLLIIYLVYSLVKRLSMFPRLKVLVIWTRICCFVCVVKLKKSY